MKCAVEIFTILGERLADFGTDARSCSAIDRAVVENGWFSRGEICSAVEAIRRDMLQREGLQSWLSAYNLSSVRPKRVAIVMAGNIPLVGFFDLMCVVASGHTAVVKPSGKDKALIGYIIELLREIEPEVSIESIDDDTIGPSSADAVIATGGDNTKRYFKSLFAGKPQLLRGNRHSVAVLSGKETEEQLKDLCDDIFMYSGLGCRNVSMIFVPHGYEPILPTVEVSSKYRNNYLQNRALLTMSGERFTDTGACLLVESDEFPSAISRIAIVGYDTVSEVEDWLAAHDEELQCVVSECVGHSRRTGFGYAQHPRLTDYPDDADVMKFLIGL